MRRTISIFCALVLVFLATGLKSNTLAKPLKLTTYVVVMSDYTGKSERSYTLLSTSHKSFKDRVLTNCQTASFENEFKYALSGFSVTCSEDDAKKMSSMQGVESVQMARYFYPQLFNSVVSTRAAEAWEMTDYSGNKITGEDVLVGVIDSGISYDHPSLSGGFNPGSKVCVGYDFANLDDDPNPEPGHLGWHGTHCAGIIGATGLPGIPNGQRRPTGIAPGTKLGAYKVFGSVGGARSDRVMAAMEMAYRDGCKVMSLSLGSSYVWADEPYSRLVDNLVDKGVVVVAAAGNDGWRDRKDLPFQVISPGGAKYAICVGALDDSAHPKVEATDVSDYPNYLTYSPPINGEIKGRLVYCGQAAPSDVKELDLTGTIALVKRGEATFYEKAKNVEAKGALACLVFNNEEGEVYGTLLKQDVAIPVVGVNDKVGEKLLAVAQSKGECVLSEASKLGWMANFSSPGPTNDFRLKPDVSAPGVNVLSCVGQNSYVEMSGTSMATPTVAGAAALMVQAHPEWTAHDVRSALINYAAPQKNKDGVRHPVLSQGTGRIDVMASLQAQALFFPTALDFGYIKGASKFTINVKNITKQTINVNPDIELDVAGDAFADLPTLTLKPGETKPYTVTITPQTEKAGEHTGYINFKFGNITARTAFLYFLGEKPVPPTISPIAMGEPAFSPNGDRKLDNLDATISINNLIGGLEIDLTDTNDKLVDVLDYSFGLMSGGNWEFGWDGKIEGQVIPEGAYRIHLYALPIGGDPTNQTQWEHFGPIEFYIVKTAPQVQFSPGILTDVYNLKGTFKVAGNVNTFLMAKEYLGAKAIKRAMIGVGKNMTELKIAENGSFSVGVDLAPGENKISVYVTDASELTTVATLTVNSLKKATLKIGKDSIVIDGSPVQGVRLDPQNDDFMSDFQTLDNIIPDFDVLVSGNKLSYVLDKKTAVLMVGQPFIIVDGKSSFCEPPKRSSDRTLVPIGAILQAFGAKREENTWTLVWRGS